MAEPSAASGSQFVDAASFHDCYRSGMKVQEFPRPHRAAPAPVEPRSSQSLPSRRL
jgi:hypothetical protein